MANTRRIASVDFVTLNDGGDDKIWRYEFFRYFFSLIHTYIGRTRLNTRNTLQSNGR